MPPAVLLAPLAPPAAPLPPVPFTLTPYKKHIVPRRQGAPPRPSSTPPQDTGSPSRIRTQSYSPKEEEGNDVLPSQPQEEEPPPLPLRSPLRVCTEIESLPETPSVPLR